MSVRFSAAGVLRAFLAEGSAAYNATIAEILGGADVIVSPTHADGTTIEALGPLLDHRLFQTLPSVESGHAFDLTAPNRPLDYVLATEYLDALGAQVLVELPG